MSELMKIARAWSMTPEEERQGALATVIRTHGSTFRRPGARMLVFDDFSTVGSVSGGCLEGSIIDTAGEVIRSGESRILRYDGARDDVVLGEGAMCDGEVAISLERIDEELSSALISLADTGHDRDLQVVVLDAERGATTRIASDLLDPADRRVLFQERIPPPLNLILCGAGALADATARIARDIGWNPLVVDHRPHFLAGMDAPTRATDKGSDLERLVEWPARTAIVVMTHQYERDSSLIDAALRLDPLYVGLLGSRGRSARIVAELQQRHPHLDLSRLHAPVGLDIGSETIEEIALSIIAEVQAVRRGAGGASLREGHHPVHGRASARIAAVLLAAGGSSRMGSPKLLLDGDSGEPLIRQTLETIRNLELNDLVVVEGAEPAVGSIARRGGARTLVNENWQLGIGSSIRLAVDSLGEDIDAALIVLADQPRISRHDLESLVMVWRRSRASVVATAYPEGGGVPAIFDRSLFDELSQLEGDRGARDLIRSLDGVELVRLEDTRDVDDPGSYASVIGLGER